MKNYSIKKKILLATIISIFISTSAVGALIIKSYNDEATAYSREQITISRKNFEHLVSSDVSMMSATMNALMDNPQIAQIFIQRDRNALYKTTSPLYNQLKERYRITHWYFHNAEPDKTAFLRVHQPDNFGDVINRVTYRKAIEKQGFSSGLELGKTAFALRVVAPYRYQGQLIGYMELGEEVDHFLGILKNQTGYDYGMIIKKEYLDEQEWAKNRKSHGLDNNWNNSSSSVLVDKTRDSEDIFAYAEAIDNLPDDGLVLEQINREGSVFAKAIFPVFDAGNQKVGGVVVLRDITSAYQAMQKKLALQITIVLLINIAVTLVLTRLTYQPIVRLSRLAKEIAAGNLDVLQNETQNKDDEIGDLQSAINTNINDIKAIIRQIRKQSDDVVIISQHLAKAFTEISDASEEVSHSVQDLADGASKQAQDIFEARNLASEMIEISQVVDSERERLVNIVRETSSLTDNGNILIQNAVNRMNQISETNQHNVEQIKALEKSSREISTIVDMITSIAGQTNMLALNAAIEAARAGEMGRGFGVVASEVSKLADESNQAAQQIADRIKTVQSAVNHIADNINEGTRQIVDGVEIANAAGNGYKKISQSITSFLGEIGKLNESTDKLIIKAQSVMQVIDHVATVTEESSQAVLNISSSTEEQAATMHDISSTSQRMAQLSTDLTDIIKKFII
ncbi:HAMP domain-containing protein [Heliobacterium chlorum]|uniref:HAMP domain-containing protein n=1 Tax=Heliobacterium chlorum TaxID=2698 RepID=A0ABR7SX02_HELCL|nr:methyl-accepting chemotaxis protein [Heliobacterium chlorum]MBC9783079.1 HAMP domain-containing protein [Heliobacterium chlorum]